MSDRRDDEFEELESLQQGFEGMGDDAPRPSREGVRILGADEARAAMESGRAQGRRAEDEKKFGDVPERPDPTVRPVARFPRPQEDLSGADDPGASEVSWSASQEGLAPEVRASHPTSVADPSGGSGPVELPHWSEPATGEVPTILPGDEPEVADPADDEAWSSFAAGAPRFRGGAEDWSDADFEGGDLKDETTSIGALADEELPDDDATFEREIADRRSRRARAGSRPRPAPEPEIDLDVEPEPEIEAEIFDGPFDDEFDGGTGGDGGDDVGVGPPPDLTLRLVTAGAMAAVALACFWIGRGATALLAAAIVGLATIEFYDGLRRRGFQPATPLGLLGSVGLVIVAYLHGSAAYPMMLTLVVAFSMLWYMAEVVRARPVSGLGATLLGFAWIGGLGGFAGLLLGAPNGIGLIVGLALCAIAYDVAGYFVGSQFGKRPLLPHISPHKTVEGLVGGMLAAIVVGFLTSTILGLTPWDGRASYGLWLGVVVAITAPLGDLCESMIKRDLDIKDFGTFLPGHGGVLDRFDGLLLSLPAVYYLVLHLGIG